MAENSFRILPILFFALMMFGHFKAISPTTTGNASSSMGPPQPTKAPQRPNVIENCKKYLPDLEKRCSRSCACGDSEMPIWICYPAVMSEEGEPDQKIKPSRRFSIFATKPPEKLEACPTGEAAHEYRSEFGSMANEFLDEYHQLFLNLTAHAKWPKCGKMEIVPTNATTDRTAAAETTNATTEPLTTMVETTETTTTTTLTTANTTKKPTTTTTTKKIITTIPQSMANVPNSYELNNELRDGCKISLSIELPIGGKFVIRLLKDYPEPIIGLSETMFKIKADRWWLTLTTRNKEEYIKRKDPNGKELLLVQKQFVLGIYVYYNEHVKKYAVHVGDKFLIEIKNEDDHPPWANNYIHIEGGLKLVGENPIKVECEEKEPAKNALRDWSKRLENEKPTELELVDIQIKDNGTLTVYLLKGCRKFHMAVCMFALEYKMIFEKGDREYSYNITVKSYSRQPPPEGLNQMAANIQGVTPKFSEKYSLNMSLDNAREIILKLQGREWHKKTLELQRWELYTHDHADFVQVVAEYGFQVGNWTLHMESKPVLSLNGDKKFEAEKTKPPWSLNHKLINWTDGDYIKLHYKSEEDAEKAVQLNLYRGYPGWIDDPNKSEDFGQLMLRIVIKLRTILELNEKRIEFKADQCWWDRKAPIRKRLCENESNLNSKEYHQDIKPPLPKVDINQRVIHIMAHNNKDQNDDEYSNGLKVHEFLSTGEHKLGYYVPIDGPPSYTIEYFQVQGGDFVLMEEPKFCRKDDKKC